MYLRLVPQYYGFFQTFLSFDFSILSFAPFSLKSDKTVSLHLFFSLPLLILLTCSFHAIFFRVLFSAIPSRCPSHYNFFVLITALILGLSNMSYLLISSTHVSLFRFLSFQRPLLYFPSPSSEVFFIQDPCLIGIQCCWPLDNSIHFYLPSLISCELFIIRAPKYANFSIFESLAFLIM